MFGIPQASDVKQFMRARLSRMMSMATAVRVPRPHNAKPTGSAGNPHRFQNSNGRSDSSDDAPVSQERLDYLLGLTSCGRSLLDDEQYGNAKSGNHRDPSGISKQPTSRVGEAALVNGRAGVSADRIRALLGHTSTGKAILADAERQGGGGSPIKNGSF